MKKHTFLFLLVAIVAVVLTSCADVQHVEQCLSGHEYGFWGGLWHGLIAPLACIGALIDNDIAVWAVNNNGGWYTLGFFIGIGGLTSCGIISKGRR